jgi:serine/threonine-protein kinase
MIEPKQNSHCDDKVLQRSLNDQLTQQQEEQLANHLSKCSNCRMKLEELAGDQNNWRRVSDALRDETSGEHVLSPTRATLFPNPQQSILDDDDFFEGTELKPGDFIVDFLKPSDSAESLGRLGSIEIRAFIGQGANGIVLKGYQEELDRLVAVKVMAPHLATAVTARKRFAREARAAAAIVHPNVMPILHVDSNGPLPFLVMPFMDCETLQQRLDREGALPLLDVLRIAVQVARGLSAAHAQGLVHRDVKPANILLERGVERVMLTDFGLARAVDDATLTHSGLIAGTPHYMSPEQARGEGIDMRSDLFSLGSVIYAMSAGRPPFRAETTYGILRRVTDDEPRSLCELNQEIPTWLNGITLKLLQKSSNDRFESAGHVASLLEDCLAHAQQPTAFPLPPAVKELLPRSQFRRVRVAVLAGGCLLLATLFIAVLVNLSMQTFNSFIGQSQNATGNTLQVVAPKSTTTEATFGWEDGMDGGLIQLDAELDSLLETTTPEEIP